MLRSEPDVVPLLHLGVPLHLILLLGYMVSYQVVLREDGLAERQVEDLDLLIERGSRARELQLAQDLVRDASHRQLDVQDLLVQRQLKELVPDLSLGQPRRQAVSASRQR